MRYRSRANLGNKALQEPLSWESNGRRHWEGHSWACTRTGAQASAVTLKSCYKSFRSLPNTTVAFQIVPAEQLVGVSELDPELADLPDAVDNDENTVNILHKNQLVTLRDFSNVEQKFATSQIHARRTVRHHG